MCSLETVTPPHLIFRGDYADGRTPTARGAGEKLVDKRYQTRCAHIETQYLNIFTFGAREKNATTGRYALLPPDFLSAPGGLCERRAAFFEESRTDGGAVRQDVRVRSGQDSKLVAERTGYLRMLNFSRGQEKRRIVWSRRSDLNR